MSQKIYSDSTLPLLAVWMVVLCALMSLHFVLIQFLLGGMDHTVTYSPVVVQHADPVFTHIPIVRKLLSGLPAFGDQFVHSMDTYLMTAWPRLPYYLLALIGWPVANHLDALPIISTVLLTPLNAAILYQLVKRLTGSVAIGVLGSSAALTFRELFVLQPWHWINADELERLFNMPFFSNALVHPQISFVVCCAALICLYKLIIGADSKTYITNGILYGISFYTYFYLWTYLTVLYGVIGLYLLWRRDYVTLFSLAKSVGLALIISSYYWVDVLRLFNQPGFADFQDRFSLGRHPDIVERIVNLRPHLITIVGFMLAISRRRINYIYLFLVTVTAELMWKMPIVIGRDYQSLHYAFHLYGPLAGITLVVGLRDLLLRFPTLVNRSLCRIVYITLGLCLSMMAIYRAKEYAVEHYMNFVIHSDTQEAYEFVRDNVSSGSVLLAADPEVNMRVRNIAPVYVYVPSGYGTFVSTEEMLTRHSDMLRYFDITVDKMLEYQWLDVISRNTYSGGLLSPENYIFNGSIKYPTNKLRSEAIIESYLSSTTKLLTYNADIVWVGPYENMAGRANMEDREELRLIYENESVQLYQFRIGKSIY